MRHRIKKVHVLVRVKMAPYGKFHLVISQVSTSQSHLLSTFKSVNLMETNTDDQICVYPKYGGIETRHRIETSNKHLRK